MGSRREFVKLGSAVAAAGVVWPRRLLADISDARRNTMAWDGLVREVLAPSDVTARALEAAKSAGALYADVNIRVVTRESWIFGNTWYGQPDQDERLSIGVRALIDGYWGFAGTEGVASGDEAAALGLEAARQAQNAAKGKPRTVDLGQTPVASGNWITPIEIDPFTVSLQEKADYFDAVSDTILRMRHGLNTGGSCAFVKEHRTFASSEGASTIQTLYTTLGAFRISVPADWSTERAGASNASFLSTAGAGWEYITKSPLIARAPEMIAEALGTRRPKPVDLGRYDIVFDASTVAQLLAGTIGEATPLDRVMGYRANDEGTSYIGSPLTALGTLQIGAPLLTVSANRTMPQGVATVKWDDEGVAPHDTTLVQEGILTDLQTTREAASWIAPYYQKIGRPPQSNGCAGVTNIDESVRQVRPNLVMKPATEDASFMDLVKNIKKGLAVVRGEIETDHQALNGTGYGEIVYRITNGELDGTVAPAEFLFRSPDFWKSLVAIGGKSSAQTFGIDQKYSVTAVPIQVKNVAITDPMRKA